MPVRALTAMVGCCLTIALFSLNARASSHYEATGSASITAMPNVATIGIAFQGYSDTAAAASAITRGDETRIIQALKKAGVADENITVDGEGPVELHNQTASQHFASMQFVFVKVQDFAALPEWTEAVTNAGNKEWSVSYSFKDRSKWVKAINKAALDDATRKARAYADQYGLSRVRLLTVKNARACFPSSLAALASNCISSDDNADGQEEIIVTARKRTEPRTDFSVPVLKQQTITATVDAVFEIQ